VSRYFYSNSVQDFRADDTSRILGELARNYPNQNLAILQTSAWYTEIEILKESLLPVSDGHIFLEFGIPRMGKRADCVLVIGDIVYVLEFKIGERSYPLYAIEQFDDYALYLKNFHEGSHTLRIIPLLICTDATAEPQIIIPWKDSVYAPLRANQSNLASVLTWLIGVFEPGATIDPLAWADSRYKPTPTIVEAAQALYNLHSVEEISRSDSGAINLTQTSDCINRIIADSESIGAKSIIFVTGVPGAGKTLAGLNIATQNLKKGDDHSVFLSGNHPLVEVLREALARNIRERSMAQGSRILKSDADRRAHAFIQNIHHFRDDYVGTDDAPVDKVVVFDEAQRAWTKEELARFMKQKRGRANFDMSEPEFLVGVMDRHDSCTVICLIGGGQEINRGEAGLDEWINSLKNYFPRWRVFFSEHIVNDPTYLRDADSRDWLLTNGRPEFDLHLKVSVRSFRSENLAAFVEALLALDVNSAKRIKEALDHDGYPIAITRKLETAKKWLTENARGTERTGITASSGALRLRPIGLFVKSQIDPSDWFLNNRDDVRSSFFHEEVATEFDIQGLELDWTCVAWDGDFYIENGTWRRRKFKGTIWQNLKDPVAVRYRSNAYRVLLTRARQGMVILVPEGDTRDKTRLPAFYDGTFDYLRSVGIGEI